MLARRETRTPPLSVLTVSLLLAACSVVPDASYPPFDEHHFAADFVVPADGRLPFPASSRCLTIQELHVSPAPHGEQFGEQGERWLLYAAGTAVHVRGRVRAYAGVDGHRPGVAELLPGAKHLQRLEGP